MSSLDVDTNSNQLKPIKIAVLVNETDWKRPPWWQSCLKSLCERQVIIIAAVWGKDEIIARKANQGLESLGSTPNDVITGLFIALPPGMQADILQVLFKIPKFNKHLFSVCPPSYDPTCFGSLHHQQQKQIKDQTILPLWYVNESVRFESAMNRVSELLDDLGQVLGGSIRGASMPQSLIMNEVKNGTDDMLFKNSVQFCAILRRVFGEIDTVSCVCQSLSSDSDPDVKNSNKILSGWVTCNKGKICSLNISSSSIPELELRVWGTSGYISVNWDNTKEYFEVRRCLKNFEHPALHLPVGSAWCLSAWVEDIIGENSNDTEHTAGYLGCALQSLVDVTVAHGLLTSQGAVVGFKVVPVKQPCRVSNKTTVPNNPKVTFCRH